MKYICTTKCYYKKREWKVGEVIEPKKDETLPGYFEPVKTKSVVVEVPEGTDPKTLLEATRINQNLEKAAQGQFSEDKINESAEVINTKGSKKRASFLE